MIKVILDVLYLYPLLLITFEVDVNHFMVSLTQQNDGAPQQKLPTLLHLLMLHLKIEMSLEFSFSCSNGCIAQIKQRR